MGKEVAVSYKETTFPVTTAIKDYERRRPNQPKSPAWLTDTSPGAWFYRPSAKFKPPNQLIDTLVDIVAKNGVMLLNVPPDPDGTIPPVMVDLLTDMGALNSKILNIELLGSKEKIKWERTERGLVIKVPKSLPSDYAHAFKIVLEGYRENDIGGTTEAHKE